MVVSSGPISDRAYVWAVSSWRGAGRPAPKRSMGEARLCRFCYTLAIVT